MSSTKTNPTLVLDTGSTAGVLAVAFHPDRKHLLAGGNGGIGRWRLEDGQEVGKRAEMKLNSIGVSRDHKWVVCGTRNGASMWGTKMQEKVIDVEGTDQVYAVDVSPDSTMFATGTNKAASVWRIPTGERLVGPLGHDVTAIRFSPNGERIAAACSGVSIRIFDSRNGDELITIETRVALMRPGTPLAWSNDGQQMFAASNDNTIKIFDVSTRLQLAESKILDGNYVDSIALAANGKFVATFANRTISFLDMSTLSRIEPIVEDSERIWAVAISPDTGYLATGLIDGKISIRDLGSILPEAYGPFHTSNREEGQPDEQPSTSGVHDNKPSDSHPENPGETSLVKSETHGDDDLLEVEVPSGAPAPGFDYDELPSPGSSGHCEDEVQPVGASQVVPQLSDALPVASPPSTHAEERVDAVESSRGITKLKQRLQMRIKKSNKDPTSNEPDRLARKSHRPADGRSPSARVDATNEGHSRMAAGQRVQRAVAKPVVKTDPKSPAKGARPKHQSKHAAGSEQGSANPNDGAQAHDASHPSGEGVHLTRESGKATLRFKITFPGWMCCGSSTGDGAHSSA